MHMISYTCSSEPPCLPCGVLLDRISTARYPTAVSFPCGFSPQCISIFSVRHLTAAYLHLYLVPSHSGASSYLPYGTLPAVDLHFYRVVFYIVVCRRYVMSQQCIFISTACYFTSLYDMSTVQLGISRQCHVHPYCMVFHISQPCISIFTVWHLAAVHLHLNRALHCKDVQLTAHPQETGYRLLHISPVENIVLDALKLLHVFSSKYHIHCKCMTSTAGMGQESRGRSAKNATRRTNTFISCADCMIIFLSTAAVASIFRQPLPLCCSPMSARARRPNAVPLPQISDVSTKGFAVVRQAAGRCTELTGGYQGRDLLREAADALSSFLKVWYDMIYFEVYDTTSSIYACL